MFNPTIRTALLLAVAAAPVQAGAAAAPAPPVISSASVQAGTRTIAVTQATLPKALESAQPGDRIVLAAAGYGVLVVPKKSWAKPVVIDATAAVFSGILIDRASGVTIQGGKVVASGIYGITVRNASRVNLTDMEVTGGQHGMVISSSTDLQILRNKFHHIRVDGVDLADVSRVLVANNTCSAFSPNSLDHPDCIQAWGTVGKPAPSDITITRNTANGDMQGIGFFNTAPGYDRVTITNNIARISFGQAVALYGGRDSVVTGNDVKSIKAGTKANVNVISSIRTKACGNLVPDATWVVPAKAC